MPLHFTDELVADLQCLAGQKDRLFFDDDLKGLAVRVTLSGARIFLIQWTDAATKQKRREVLGAFGAITTAQARKAAKAKLGHVALGLDPRAERLAKQEAAKREKAALLEAKAEAAFTLDTLISCRSLPRSSAGIRKGPAQASIRAVEGAGAASDRCL
jgi:hypothetical protein